MNISGIKWGTYVADNDSIHVCPISRVDNNRHFLDEFCFCTPVLDDGVWIHNMIQ